MCLQEALLLVRRVLVQKWLCIPARSMSSQAGVASAKAPRPDRAAALAASKARLEVSQVPRHAPERRRGVGKRAMRSRMAHVTLLVRCCCRTQCSRPLLTSLAACYGCWNPPCLLLPPDADSSSDESVASPLKPHPWPQQPPGTGRWHHSSAAAAAAAAAASTGAHAAAHLYS
jgi:hypothetical protein